MADEFRRNLDLRCCGFNVHVENPFFGKRKKKLNRLVRRTMKHKLNHLVHSELNQE